MAKNEYLNIVTTASVMSWCYRQLSPWPDRLQQAEYAILGARNGQVDHGRLSVYADGAWYDVSESQLRIIVRLTETPGAWVSGDDLRAKKGSGERPDKLIKQMPEPVRKNINSHTSNGYRWVDCTV